MKQQQSLLILCDDQANLAKIAAGLRGIPGVKEVRAGTFRKEHVMERTVGMFFPTVGKAAQPPGIEVAERPTWPSGKVANESSA